MPILKEHCATIFDLAFLVEQVFQPIEPAKCLCPPIYGHKSDLRNKYRTSILKNQTIAYFYFISNETQVPVTHSATNGRFNCLHVCLRGEPIQVWSFPPSSSRKYPLHHRLHEHAYAYSQVHAQWRSLSFRHRSLCRHP